MTVFYLHEDFEGVTSDVTGFGIGLGSEFSTSSVIAKHGSQAMSLTNCSAKPTDWPGNSLSGGYVESPIELTWSMYFMIVGDNGIAALARQVLKETTGGTSVEFGILYDADGDLTPYVGGYTGTDHRVTKDEWHLLDYRTTFSTTHVTMDWMIDGVDQGATVQALGFNTSALCENETPNILANNAAPNGTLYIDDWWLAGPDAYPIGDHPYQYYLRRQEVMVDQLEGAP